MEFGFKIAMDPIYNPLATIRQSIKVASYLMGGIGLRKNDSIGEFIRQRVQE